MDIERLSRDELIDLNRRVVRRIRYLNDLKTGDKLNRFAIGDRVSFQGEGQTVEGTVIRVNRKSLSVRVKDTIWRIHPDLVSKVASKPDISHLKLDFLSDARISEN